MKNTVLLWGLFLIAGCETNIVSEVPFSERPANLQISNVIEVAKSGATYDSIKPAIAAAFPGDLIVVYPGTYNDSTPTMLKDSVDIYLSPGARIVNNKKEVSSNGGTVFWDTLGPVRTKIYGNGYIGYDSGISSESFAIHVTDPASDVYVEADTLFGFAMVLSAEGGRLTVRCPYILARCEHGIRTRNGGFVELTGNLYSCDSCRDGGGQAVYFQGNSDTVIINGDVYHEGGVGGILCAVGDTGVFILYGNITSKNSRALDMRDGKAYLYGSTVKTNGAMRAENLYAYKSSFDQIGAGYVFGSGSNDTAYLSNCVGDSGIHPFAIWFGDYRQYGMGKIRHRK